ncbi:MAG TPA: phosphodiester glycosidase family protein [Actinomycetota bacterium]
MDSRPRSAARLDRHGLSRRLLALLSAIAVLGPGFAGQAARRHPGISIPRGYRLVAVQELRDGVFHYELRGTSFAQSVQVARIPRSAGLTVRPALSRGRIKGSIPRTSQTSAMCRSADCLIATNADFYYVTGAPVGGLVIRREPIASSSLGGRPHLLIAPDRTMKIGRLRLDVEMVSRHPVRVETAVGPLVLEEHIEDEKVVTVIDGINVDRGKNDIVMYTPRMGKRTTTTGGGIELRLDRVGDSKLRLGERATYKIAAARSKDDSKIKPRSIVLSGRGDGADVLARLWDEVERGAARAKVRISVSSPSSIVGAVGGNPRLVKDGAVVEQDADSFSLSRHPRTMVGWNAKGDLLMVTVDGRSREARGSSLPEAALFMKRLGAVEALNLDGGGSATFVVRGRVRNRPSDGYERRVADALLVLRP